MSDDKKNQGFDTVPPPAGEDDAYSAPTRVGPMANAVVQEMMHAAALKAIELTQHADAKEARARATPPAPDAPPKAPMRNSRPPPVPAPRKAETDDYALDDGDLVEDTAPPRVYDEEDDEDNAATLLSKSARAPIVSAAGAAQAPTPQASPVVDQSSVPTSAPPPFAAPLPTRTSSPPRSFGAPSAFDSPGSFAPPTPFTPPSPFAQPPNDEDSLAIYFPLVIGFAILFAGIALYVWAR
jgi:hypothetical protein